MRVSLRRIVQLLVLVMVGVNCSGCENDPDKIKLFSYWEGLPAPGHDSRLVSFFSDGSATIRKFTLNNGLISESMYALTLSDEDISELGDNLNRLTESRHCLEFRNPVVGETIEVVVYQFENSGDLFIKECFSGQSSIPFDGIRRLIRDWGSRVTETNMESTVTMHGKYESVSLGSMSIPIVEAIEPFRLSRSAEFRRRVDEENFLRGQEE